MEESNTLSEQAARFRDRLAAGRVEEIDFDALTSLLGEVTQAVNGLKTRDESLNALRQDYEGRVIGMVKAMAAVDRSGRSYDEVLASLEELPSLSGEELVARYRKVSARFRDIFPATFGHGVLTVRTKPADMSIYK